MPNAANFEAFEKELIRLVGIFERGLGEFNNPSYAEAQLRDDFLNPFFRALGWDLENSAGLIQRKREVEIESRTEINGRKKRADYLFRADGRDRFICEAKRPAEELHSGFAFQAKRYAWNKSLPLAILANFQEFKIYIVGGKPHLEDDALAGLWKTWRLAQLPLIAREIWNLLARDNIAAGSIDLALESFPKAPPVKGKARQLWLIKPDRSRSIDVEFLNFLDGARRELGFDLIRNNSRADLLEGHKLNEAVQRILDRILFLRICEDRDIDTGMLLASIAETWARNYGKEDLFRPHQQPLEFREEPPSAFGSGGVSAPKESLWRAIVRHFRALDRRPPSHVPFFNGNLFKPHFCEELIVGDAWLASFIEDLSDTRSAYLFSYIPVEILGSVYERFLGKVVRPQGRGVTIEDKPEVRKAGGVYYTPSYIVEYIVAQTVEKLLQGAKPEATLQLHFLDPACGSGSFLLRVFEAVCEHWEQWFTDHPGERKKKWCWVDEKTRAVHLTMSLKRRILLENIFGVDIDPGAVEVTQLSLYLKMLEHENRNTLELQRALLPGDDGPLLPPLENNIQCGNSLIASDFSMIPDDLIRVRAFDWDVGFKEIMKTGGFDAVMGNPPYGADIGEDAAIHLRNKFESAGREVDSYAIFIEQGVRLLRSGGFLSMIVPTGWYSGARYPGLRRFIARNTDPTVFVNLPYDVFADAWVDTTIFATAKRKAPTMWPRKEPCPVALLTFGKRAKIKSIREFEAGRKFADFAEWFTDAGDTYLTYANGTSTRLIKKLESTCVPLSTYADIQRGVTPFHLTDKPTHKTSKPAFDGTVRRYSLEPGPAKFVRFDKTLMEFKPAKYFQGPRLLVRELISRQFQLQGMRADDSFVTNKSMQSILPVTEGPNVNFLLGCLNSRLLSWFFLKKSNIAQRDDFPKIVLKETRSLPFPKINLKTSPDKARHDKMVNLVDKMLALTPRLRQARSESERNTLQNAVTAADRQIDALVYDLYGLTEKEIKLVEGGQE
jgi:hypothetical protein